MNEIILKNIIVFLCISLLITGCRGYKSENTPVHLNVNMDFQSKIMYQKHGLTPPDGTIPWGKGSIYAENNTRADHLMDDDAYYRGKNANGKFISKFPVTVDAKLLERGEERFNIYCAVCHDRAGTGKAPVISRGYLPPPDYIDPRLLKFKDGEIFDVITNGIRNMQGYGKQIPVHDRWAIAAYVRVLQKMRSATMAEVSDEVKGKLN